MIFCDWNSISGNTTNKLHFIWLVWHLPSHTHSKYNKRRNLFLSAQSIFITKFSLTKLVSIKKVLHISWRSRGIWRFRHWLLKLALKKWTMLYIKKYFGNNVEYLWNAVTDITYCQRLVIIALYQSTSLLRRKRTPSAQIQYFHNDAHIFCHEFTACAVPPKEEKINLVPCKRRS